MARGQEDYLPRRRLAFVRLAFFVFFLIIAWRLFQLQVLSAGHYQRLAQGQHDLYSQLVPERGEVFIQDPLSPTKLAPAAVNRQRYLVFAVPNDVTDPSATARTLGPVLGVEPITLGSALGKAGDPYEPLQHAVSEEMRARVDALSLAGIHTTPELIRTYPEGDRLGQVLGFVGFVGDRRIGQYGIEGGWETELAGIQGALRSERDAVGGLITLGERDLIEAQDGVDLVLTIDKNIQFRACTALAAAVARHGAASGSIVIVEPASGAVRALCNAPSFDSNAYGAVKQVSDFSNLAVSAPYEPGSVMKAITMAAALEARAVTPDTTYVDTGEIRIGPDVMKNSDGKSHGRQTMTQVLEESLNTGAIFAMRSAGVKAFKDMVSAFGFGENTGLELPHEQAGSLATLGEKQEIYAATASFGQGITATPLQLVTAFAAIANRGRLMKPYLVQEVRQSDGRVQVTEPTLVRQVIAPQVASTLSAMLVSVVERGHGKRAGVPGYYVGGKTGTAQVSYQDRSGYDPDKNIGTFIGFAPADNPRFAMVVKIVEPRGVVFAESSAAPVFGEVARYLLEYYQVPPSRPIK